MQRYTGMGDCFKRHISELGATSLWRGNVANCIRYVPTAACNLMFKDTEIAKFAMTQVASGSVAGGITNTLVYPLIYVRTALGADIGAVKKYSGVADCLKKTVAQNGVSSLYNGIGPSTIGIDVYRGTQFGLQDTIKAFNPYQKDTSLIGLDTLQRRLQNEATKPKAEQIYNGMSDCFAKILKDEGPKGFFKGALANVLRGTGAAIVLVMYDEIMNFIERKNSK